MTTRLPIRWRLTIWYAAFLAGSIILLGAGFYLGTRTLLFGFVEEQLEKQSALAQSSVQANGITLAIDPNTVANLHWLLAWTPFGWAQHLNPVLDPQLAWTAPFVALAALFIAVGVWLAQRDLGSATIKQSEITRSRFYLLGSPAAFALRQNKWVYAAWLLGGLIFTGIIASITSIAVDATTDSPALSKSIQALGHSTADLKIAFLGAGLVFLVMVLLIMVTTVMGSIRGDEAKQYLDSILTQPHSRSGWLAGRLAVGLGATLAVSLLSGLLLYAIAHNQRIDVDLGKVLAASVGMMGSIGFLLGLGALLYGLRPRLAVPVMYLALLWSFIISLVSSAANLNKVVLDSSLFNYTSFNLAAWPDWTQFGALLALGAVMAAAGIVLFNKRDIVSE